MKRALERLGLPVLRSFDPETAHGLALKALQMGLTPGGGPVTSKRLKVQLAGLDLPNPIGLAAGFDKNATAVAPLLQTGFGFIEVGAATPRPQPGNPKPRLFRLGEDGAVINRFGFNNEGMDAICARLQNRPASGVVGLNLGANKDSADRAADFATVLRRAAKHVDFATVNVSSTNTEKLRDLQGREALAALLKGVQDSNATGLPVFLKIAPDLDDAGLDDIAHVALDANLAGVIATNTTLSRSGLTSAHKSEAGGLSGAPLFERSTIVLARLADRLDGQMPLIGVGGVTSAGQAYAKIRAGAQAVQFYSALVYAGISLAADIARGLDDLLKADGFANVQEAVGLDQADWASRSMPG